MLKRTWHDHRAWLVVVLAAVAVSSCGRSPSGPSGAAQPAAETAHRPGAPKAAAPDTGGDASATPAPDRKNTSSTPLDLAYKPGPGMANLPDDNTDPSTERPLSDLFDNGSEDKRVQLNGRLMLDPTDRFYAPAIQGGEVGVKIKIR